MLGRDHDRYGEFDHLAVGAEAAAAISVGADPHSPSNRFKREFDTSNEDALCVVATARRTAAVVADAHFGPESSHALVRGFYDGLCRSIPRDLDELDMLIDELGRRAEAPRTESETSLLVVVHDHKTGYGFGRSFSDCSLCIVGPGSAGEPINDRRGGFVDSLLFADQGAPFDYRSTGDDLVIAFTDGIDECHYRNPDTSLTAQIRNDLIAEADFEPAAAVIALTEQALDGVAPNPGGQDNIALVAFRATRRASGWRTGRSSR